MARRGMHETAVISDRADLEDSVTVGPFAVIESGARVGSGTLIGPHAVIRENCIIGRNNVIDAHAVLGGEPQHVSWEGGETRVRIGDENVIREAVTVHRAFRPGAETVIGSGCFLMAGSHVGHDCRVADGVVLTNGVMLGGHVEVGTRAVIGGNASVHQFVRIGAFSMVAGQIALRKDVLPYMTIGGEPVRHFRLNAIGLRRHGIDGERYRALEQALRLLRSGGDGLDGLPETDEIRLLRDWLAARSKYGRYGFATPR